jgi:hypothetical protein
VIICCPSPPVLSAWGIIYPCHECRAADAVPMVSGRKTLQRSSFRWATSHLLTVGHHPASNSLLLLLHHRSLWAGWDASSCNSWI